MGHWRREQWGATGGAVAAGTISSTTAGGLSAAAGAVAAGAATNATVSVINNRGNLGAVFKDVTSSDAMKGYAVSGIAAGLTAAYFDGWTGTETNTATGKIVPPSLSTWKGIGQFAANQSLQNGTSLVLNKALGQGGSANETLKNVLFNTLAAVSFNAVGDYTQGVLADGSLPKIAVHAMVGGLLSKATGGDFKTGALAAGANEALVVQLDTLVKGNENLLTMSSQIVGVLAAAGQKDADAAKMEKGSWVAKNSTQYNFLGDHSAAERDRARKEFEKDQGIDSAKKLVTLEGADQRSDNLLAAYRKDPGSLSKDQLSELTAYLQVYAYEQIPVKGEQQVKADLANLLQNGPTPTTDFSYAGTTEAKNAYADAVRAELGWAEQLFWSRDKSANELTYRDAQGVLRINTEQQGLANIGGPAIYGLSGPLGATIRIAAAANGVLQAGYGANQALNGDTWNAVGNMVVGALGVASLGIPGAKPVVGGGAKGSVVAGEAAGAGPKNPLLADSISRDGDRLVLNQGPIPTCGHNSCGMVLDTMGKKVDVESLIQKLAPSKDGIFPQDVASLMKSEGVPASAFRSRNVADLARYTSDGTPVVVQVVDKTGGSGFSHFVVVDGVTTRNGVSVVAIRDSHGSQYFSPVTTFEKNFTGEVVVPRSALK